MVVYGISKNLPLKNSVVVLFVKLITDVVWALIKDN